ncbi:hypothetical protein CF70_022360 [Cupriavidus sp. SK-3]|uniref:hypothetical protein n=1 Tax=Cupriavidus sp. SK-3 TaxID=1470558 RepID=UPI00044A1711|nr:hypothetical protein [Cupriavidus sp. SK-3]KDP83917.1 hypothetical protein CF70_022360 [Cupriavidus sp. SK-3]
MSDKLQQYCATDKEIYDLLMSGKQKLTESVLHELARDRGIFYSPKTTREGLVDRLALLTHDFHDVVGVIERREHTKRGEKTTSVTLGADLSVDEIKEVVNAYQAEVRKTEKVTSHKKGADGVIMNIEYNEYDYSRTRLIQRQRKDAGIEFVSKNGVTTIRMPATEKAKAVVRNLRDKIESKKKVVIPAQEIELVGLTKAEHRTSFFTSLIANIPGYSLQTVTNLKVASGVSDQEEDTVELDEDEDESARQEMLAVVHSVAIQGKNLVASEQYQQLRKGGFFITAITWRSKQQQEPQDMIQFDASFDDGPAGTGFKYGVRYASRLPNGDYAKNFKPVEDHLKPLLFELIETTARKVLADLFDKANADSAAPDEGGTA